MKTRLILYSVFLWLFSASGASADITDILSHERTLLSGQCTEIEFYPGFIDVTDLNGDRWDDAIIDYQYLMCDGSFSAFCGTGGCTLRLYSGGPKGTFSEAAEFLSRGLKTKGRGKRMRLLISLHGSECGRPGAASCVLTGRLGRGTFIVDSKR
ncbi:hypothetical protein [Hyphomicrobium sp.]|uniref:hypothetical protein n=1 Tax=Hyphomicrobium sp. TaxID=82 RepID=UPI002FE1792D